MAGFLALTTGCAAEAPPVSDRVEEVYASQRARAEQIGSMTVKTAPPAERVTIPAALLEPGTKAVFFGDSWTGGYAAAEGRGYAHVTAEMLGWDERIEALSGTGYLRAEDKPTYPLRAETFPVDPSVQVVIVQGGANDEGTNLLNLKVEAIKTYAAMRAQFPQAAIVVLGPAPSFIPASSTQVRIDEVLAEAATESKASYVSPIREGWITADNVDTVIDLVKDAHPGTEGHQYIATRLVEALRALAA